MILQGNLSEYPLSVLLEIFLQREETGELEVSWPGSSGYFYFKGGELIDAAAGKLRGRDALDFADGLPQASFKFTPLGPDEFTRALSRLSAAPLEEPDETPLCLPALPPAPQRPFYAASDEKPVGMSVKERPAASLSPPRLPAPLRTRDRARPSFKQWVPVAAALLLFALVAITQPARFNESSSPATAPPPPAGGAGESPSVEAAESQPYPALRGALAATTVARLPEKEGEGKDSPGGAVQSQPNPARGRGEAARPSPGSEKRQQAETRRREGEREDSGRRKVEPALKSKPSPDPVNTASKVAGTPGAGTQTVAVSILVEDGKVTQAFVKNRRPGMEAFEAAALRIARRRRYDPNMRRSETVLVRINQPR